VNNQLLTQPFQVFLILAIVYYIICWSLTHVANVVERRIARRRTSFRGTAVDETVAAPNKILTEQL
jgi:polar amino acid transport system permease protein